MKQTSVSTILLLIFLTITPLSPDAKVSFEPVCGIDPELIAKNLAKRDFPNRSVYFTFPVAANDAMCETEENMLNIAVIFMDEPQKYYYGIFHVHFIKIGEIKSAATILKWTFITNLDDPVIQTSWCDFLKNSMDSCKNDLKNWGCN